MKEKFRISFGFLKQLRNNLVLIVLVLVLAYLIDILIIEISKLAVVVLQVQMNVNLDGTKGSSSLLRDIFGKKCSIQGV